MDRPKDPRMEPSASPEIDRGPDTVPPRTSLDGGEGEALLEHELTPTRTLGLLLRNIAQTEALKGSVDTLYEALMFHLREERAAQCHAQHCHPALQWTAVAMAALALASSAYAVAHAIDRPLTIGCQQAEVETWSLPTSALSTR